MTTIALIKEARHTMSDIYHSNNYTNSFRSADGTGSPVDHDDRTGGWQNINDPNYRVDRTRHPGSRGSRGGGPRLGLIVLLCAVIAFAAGIGGAFAGLKLFGGSGDTVTVRYDSAQGGSQTSAVSYEDGGTGLTIAQAAAKASPSVVEISIEATVTSQSFFGGEQTYQARGAGSGVIISADGYIITNNHVVKDADEITVTTYDGAEYKAEVIGTDESADIAVIKVDAEGLIPATVGDSSAVRIGDTALVIGNPLGTLGGSVSYGIISATVRELVIDNTYMELIQTDATINSGNSGGGMFDGNGNLIGIVNAKDSGTTSSGAVIEGLGYAIPINYAMQIAEDLIEHGEVVNRATIGVSVQTLTEGNAQYPAGVYIMDLTTGGGAEAAGLQPYDRILTIDGYEINAYTDISHVLRQHAPGDTIEMVVVRAGEEMTVSVTLTGVLS